MVIESAVIVVVILALCQALKMAGVAGKYIPLFAVILGIVAGVWVVKDLSIISTIVAGLASVGLWEFSTKTVAIATGKY